MLCFTRYNMLYAATMCFFFGVAIGLAVFASGADQLCPTIMNNGTTGLCYVAIGAGAAGMAGIAWPFMPHHLRAFISLVGTMPGGHVFNIQMGILAWKEVLKAIRHLQALTIIPLETAECLREETAYSLQLVRRSMFSESHVADMNRGIVEVASTFDQAKRAQDRFRDAIERGFRWLEQKGMTCRETLERPYNNCLAEADLRYQRCHTDDWNSFKTWHENPTGTCIAWDMESPFLSIACSSLRTLSKGACGIFSEEHVTRSLLAIRDRIASWISNAVKMRVGISFELYQTNYVGVELSNAWGPFKAALNTGSSFVGWLYDMITTYLIKFMFAIAMIVYPIYYMLNYNFGSLKFDNAYIPEEEEEKENEVVDDDTAEELRYLPLQLGTESETIQMIPTLIPTPPELWKLIKSCVWGYLDLAVVLLILVADFFYTKLIDNIYFATVHIFNRYQGNIFDFVRDEEAKGLRYIGQLLVEQLDKLQQAAGLGRMLACARRALPIDYTYGVFILIFAVRLYYHFSQVKLAWLPSMICARYNRVRHNQRMRCLKAKVLLERENYVPPEPFPWLKSFFSYFCGCCTLSAITPTWISALIDT